MIKVHKRMYETSTETEKQKMWGWENGGDGVREMETAKGGLLLRGSTLCRLT